MGLLTNMGLVNWLRIQSLHLSFEVIGQSESLVDRQNMDRCPLHPLADKHYRRDEAAKRSRTPQTLAIRGFEWHPGKLLSVNQVRKHLGNDLLRQWFEDLW